MSENDLTNKVRKVRKKLFPFVKQKLEERGYTYMIQESEEPGYLYFTAPELTGYQFHLMVEMAMCQMQEEEAGDGIPVVPFRIAKERRSLRNFLKVRGRNEFHILNKDYCAYLKSKGVPEDEAYALYKERIGKDFIKTNGLEYEEIFVS